MSGIYPHQTGIRGNDPVMPRGFIKKEMYKPGNEALKDQWVNMRNRMTGPMANAPSMVKLLQQKGYATLQTGKWWEGNPLDHGFTDAMTHGDPTRGGRHGDKGLLIGRRTMKPIYDFVATTILLACGITPPDAMSGLDLRDSKALAKRDRIFVDVYAHDSNIDQLDDLASCLNARVVIDGWDKLVARPAKKEYYDLKNDSDDRNDIATQNPEKVERLSNLIDEWMQATPALTAGGKY